MGTDDIKKAVESVRLKAESRSERIEGKIRESMGEMDNDPEAIEDGQTKQETADALEKEAENK